MKTLLCTVKVNEFDVASRVNGQEHHQSSAFKMPTCGTSSLQKFPVERRDSDVESLHSL